MRTRREFLELRDSPVTEQIIELSDTLWDQLDDVRLDANQHKFIWPDAERLDLEELVRRIQAQSGFPETRSRSF